jgi:hypothetical protein
MRRRTRHDKAISSLAAQAVQLARNAGYAHNCQFTKRQREDVKL